MRNVIIACALLALPGQAVAQSAKSCLAPLEAEALVTYALPSAIRAIATKCTTALPATASLIQSGPILAARYQFDADKAWPVARQAFDKVSGIELTKVLGEAGTKGLIETALGAGLTEKVKPGDCSKIDRFIDILEPLPTRNMAMLITALMELGGSDDKKSPLKMCPDQPGRQ